MSITVRFLGHLGNNLFQYSLGRILSEELGLARFRPEFLELPALASLQLFQRASRIILANSTFSWWGAFLSDATEIYFPRPLQGMWSPDRPEVDLEVADDRYRYVDNVPLEEWRPLSRAPHVPLQMMKSPGGQDQLRLAAPAGRVYAIDIPPRLVPFAAWLTQQRTAFGTAEIDAFDLTPAGRAQAWMVLSHLRKLGVLKVPAEIMASLLQHYGIAAADTARRLSTTGNAMRAIPVDTV